jgi:nitrogen-specific signal transduction histidine kinase
MHALALTLIGVLHVIVAVTVWRARPDRIVNRVFAFQTVALAGWTFGNAGLQTGMWLNGISRLTFAAASFLPTALLIFTIHYPAASSASHIMLRRVALITASFFAAASLGTDWIVHDVRFEAAGPTRRPGLLYPCLVLYFLIIFGAGLTIFIGKWWHSKDRERTQLNYYGVGVFIAVLGGVLANLVFPATTGRSNLSHIGPYFGLPFIALTAHATIRHRFMDLRIVIHRGLTFAVTLILSLIPPVAAVLLLSGSVLDELTALHAMVGIGSLLGVVLLASLLWNPAEHLLDRYVYRAQADMQRLLRRASADLTSVLDRSRLVDVIVNTIRTVVQPEGIAVYLEHEGVLTLSNARRLDTDSQFHAHGEVPELILKGLVSRRIPLLRAELDAPGDSSLRSTLNACGWAVTLPLFVEDRLIGVVAVGPKRSGDPFFSEDVDALATLANHAGSAVGNANLYAQVSLANEYLRNIVTAMQNGVVAVDVNGDVTLINPAGRQMLGLPDSGRVTAVMVGEPLSAILRDIVTSGSHHSAREMRLLGESQPVLLCTASPLRDHSGALAGGVAVFSDLKLVKELDHERARTERLVSLQSMTQALAHEIGNPLTPIKALARILPERHADPEFVTNFSRIVGREIDRIERLVVRLRRLAPQAPGDYARIDLRFAVRHVLAVVDVIAKDQATEIVSALGMSEAFVVGDAAELEELFLNLLTNALEAVATQPAGPRRIHVGIIRQENSVTVEVADTGQGVREDVAGRLFDPFVTTKPRGSGLGLAICAGIVQRHHGRITVTNATDGGALFAVMLPLAE